MRQSIHERNAIKTKTKPAENLLLTIFQVSTYFYASRIFMAIGALLFRFSSNLIFHVN